MNIKTRSRTMTEKIKGYCMKCKAHRMMKEAKKVKTKNDRNMMRGICPVCGTGMAKFVK